MTTCPSNDRLRTLLDGQLSESEQAELQQHIDLCEHCQQTLEGLVAGKESWDGIARRLVDGDTPVTPALHDAIVAAKEMEATIASVKLPPGMLLPSEQADSMGRLAHYEVLQEVGSGGMGIVLKAFDTSLRRVVAIKVMAPHLAANAAARRRFVREAQAAAAVAHEHVVAIHAVADQHDPPYLAMQFIEGKTLQERLDESGPLSVREVLRIGMQTAAGLAAAHAQGLVHRDIKPANILLENGVERVKLTDFGLARAVDDASVTQSGVIAGTPQYMSPEQARGDVVDHRSDLFSLGSVMYAMCVGHSPFRASTTMGVIKRVCDDTPRPIREVNSDVPEWLTEIIDHLLAKNAADRIASAKEVAELLGQCLAHLQQPQTNLLPLEVADFKTVVRSTAATNPMPVKPQQQTKKWDLRIGGLMMMFLIFTMVALEGVGVSNVLKAIIGGCLQIPFFLFLIWFFGRQSARVKNSETTSLPSSANAPRVPFLSSPMSALPVHPMFGAIFWFGLTMLVISLGLATLDQLHVFSASAVAPLSGPFMFLVGIGSVLLVLMVVVQAISKRDWRATSLGTRPVLSAVALGVLIVIEMLMFTAWGGNESAAHPRDPAMEFTRGIPMGTLLVIAAGLLLAGVVLGIRGLDTKTPGGRQWGTTLSRVLLSILVIVLITVTCFLTAYWLTYAEPNAAMVQFTLQVAGPHVEITLNGEKAVSRPDISQVDLQLPRGEYVISTLEKGQLISRSAEALNVSQTKSVIDPKVDAIRITGPFVMSYGPGAKAPNVADYIEIQGRWTIVSEEKDGELVTAPQRGKWIEFDRGRIRFDVPITPKYQAFFAQSLVALYSTENPSQIDILDIGAKGIYRLDRDTLTLSIADQGRPRPTEFVSRPGSSVTLTVCRRIVESETLPTADGDEKSNSSKTQSP